MLISKTTAQLVILHYRINRMDGSELRLCELVEYCRWCYLFWNPFVPSGPRGVRMTRTPRGGGDGNTPDTVAPGGRRVRTLRSLPLVLLSL